MSFDLRMIISVLTRYFRRRKQAQEFRRELAHENAEHLIELGKARNARAKLVAKQRQRPEDFPSGPIPLDPDWVMWYAECFLEPNEDPRVPLDSLERVTSA